MNRNLRVFRWMAAGVGVGLLSLGSVLPTGCAVRPGGGLSPLPVGEVRAGQQAFADLMCYTCHRVVDPTLAFPAPTANPPVPVALGAEAVKPTGDEWVRSIIDPSHEISLGYREELVAEGRLSRMGDYTHLLTVRQLADLVAFLDSLHARRSAGD